MKMIMLDYSKVLHSNETFVVQAKNIFRTICVTNNIAQNENLLRITSTKLDKYFCNFMGVFTVHVIGQETNMYAT